MTRQRPPLPSDQRGVMLLETLIALLIFSVGILALVGLQALAIRQVADAKLRSDASYLANQIIAQMWIDRSSLADYAHFVGGTNCTFTGSTAVSPNVTTWVGNASQPGSVAGSLPNPAAQIKVQTSTNLVTVTLCWRAPQETQTHNFTATALISG